MVSGKMHSDEVEIDVAQAGRLIAAQFPRWAGLPLAPVHSSGTDNAMFRLGDDKALRFPRYVAAAGQVEKEQLWLPRLAPALPLPIPEPLGMGQPAEGYPFRWSVCRWLEGDNAAPERIGDAMELAAALASFIAALRAIDPAGGPPPGPHNSFRGVPLAFRDEQVRRSIARLGAGIDGAAATIAWEAALAASPHAGPPAWMHGDLHADNLLVRHGRLAAVIDFGCLGVGDPACELAVAWLLLTPATRLVFRSMLEVDDAAWARGRGWALSIALIALPYYLDTNPGIVERSRRALEEVLADAR